MRCGVDEYFDGRTGRVVGAEHYWISGLGMARAGKSGQVAVRSCGVGVKEKL